MAQLHLSLWRILLLFTTFAALAMGCIPAFNDFKYTDNATLLEEVVAQYEANPAMGWAHVLGGTSPLKPWPKDEHGVVNIKYCWPDLDTKNKLGAAIQGGWQMWHVRLGNGGPGSGHRIGGLSEYKHGDELVFCWIDEDRSNWNPKVPSGTLVIQIDPARDFGGWASMGYNPEQWDNRPHRNQIRLGWAEWHANYPAMQHWLAAHEIGHVLGLTHEHQRADRDHYVHFECKNLNNYDKAEQLTHYTTGMTMNKLCSSPIYSQMDPWRQLAFVPHEYSTIPYYDMFHQNNDGQRDGTDHRYTVTYDRKYDINSIMHYPSADNIAKGRDQNAVQNMPLVAWKGGWEGFVPQKVATPKNAQRLDMNIVPTESDCKGVKALYPWEERVLMANRRYVD